MNFDWADYGDYCCCCGDDDDCGGGDGAGEMNRSEIFLPFELEYLTLSIPAPLTQPIEAK